MRSARVAIIVHQVLLIVAVLARPEIDAFRKPVSEYAIGRHGWLTVTAFLAAAISYGALALATRGFGQALLALCGVATAGVGVFVADPVVTPLDQLTAGGRAHVVCGLLALVLFPFAALLIGRDLGMPRWLTFLPLAALILHYLLSAVIPPEGIPPRLLFLAYAVWVVQAAQATTQGYRFQARRSPRGSKR